MRTTRILGLVALGAVLAGGLVMAAGHPCGWARGARRERLSQQLGLSAEQQAKVQAIGERYRGEFRKLRAESTGREARQAQVRDLREKMHAEISALLTPEQRAKLEQWRATRGWHRHGPRAMMERAARELGLTPEQREKVRGIYAAHRDEIRALARDAHAPDVDRSKMRARATELKEKVVAEIRPILTPQQQEKLQAMLRRWEEHVKS